MDLDNETGYPQAIAIVTMVVMMFVGLWKKQSTFVLVIFLITAYEIIQACLARRHIPRLIIDSRGIHRVRAGTVQKSIPWADLAEFKYSRLDGGLLAKTKSGRTVALTRNAKIAKQCRQDIEHAWVEFHGRTQQQILEQPPQKRLHDCCTQVHSEGEYPFGQCSCGG